MHKVFVYGTLKEGFPNFASNSGRRFRGDFITSERFLLYLIGERHSPWLVFDTGNGYRVRGQLFEVTEYGLLVMDGLERINESDGYRRVTIDVLCLETHETFNVYIYVKPVEMVKTSDIRVELTSEYCVEHANLYRSRIEAR